MNKNVRLVIFSFIFLLILLTPGYSNISETFEEQVNNTLPVFNLIIPESSRMMRTMQEYNDSEIKIIVSLKDPEKIWKNEVSSMSSFERTNLKQVMRSHIIDNFDLKTKHRYTSFNGFSATVSPEQYEALLESSLVESLSLNRKVTIFLEDSVSIIGADKAWNYSLEGQNLTGKGQTICVIDTGIDYTHNDLGGCLGDGCKVLGGYDFVNNNNDPMDDHGHGTHVAGIVAANGNVKGVAPDSNLIAIKALESSGEGDFSDVIAGIDWCIDNASKYNISVISMSLGAGSYSTYCDNLYSSVVAAINNAISNNISVVVATGNDYLLSNIASPACIENSTRVGSTIKEDDALSSFSNRWALDMLVAPGSNIYSTLLSNSYGSQSGTSMATPHVSGAIALVNQYLQINNESMTPKEIESLLNNNSKIIYDSNSERNYSRIDINSTLLSFQDFIPPEVNISKSFSILKYGLHNITINWSVTDDSSGIHTVIFNITSPNSSLVFFSDEESGRVVLSPDNLTEIGTYIINLKANDTAGNTNSANTNFTVFMENLTIILHSPKNQTYNNLTQLVNISAEDNFEVDNIWYNWNGTNYTYEEPIEIIFNEGLNTLYAWANNTFGDIKNSSVNFNVYVALPEINKINLSNYIFQTGAKVFVTVNVTSNISIISVTAEGKNLTQNGDIWSGNISLFSSPLSIVVIDSIDNVVTDNSTTFIIDDVPPSLNATISYNNSSLFPGNWYNHSLTVSLFAYDENNISSIEWKYVNETEWTVYEEPFDINDSTENKILYRATDTANNVAVPRVLDVRIDKEAPVIEEVLVSSNKTLSSILIGLFIKTKDSFSGINNIITELNGTIYEEFVKNNGYYTTTILTPNDPGIYEVNITVMDNVGNINTSVINITIVEGSTHIFSYIPKNVFLQEGTVAEFHFSNVSNGTYNTSLLNTTNISGNESLSIVIENVSPFEINFNFSNLNETFVYYIDNTSPNLTFGNLPTENVLNGTYKLLFECVDNKSGVKNIDLYINNYLVNLSSINNYYDLDTLQLSNSNHTLTFICYDYAGNMNISEFNISVNNNFTITKNTSEGQVFFENTHVSRYIDMISGINSTNVSLKLYVLDIPNVSLQSNLTKKLLYLNINASTPFESRVYFTLPKNFLENVNISRIKLWSNHSNSDIFEGPYDIYLTENRTDEYKFYFITTDYSDFLIGEEEEEINDTSESEDNGETEQTGGDTPQSPGGGPGGALPYQPPSLENVVFTISRSELLHGHIITMEKGDILEFEIENEHTLTIGEIHCNSVELTIASLPQLKNLGKNDTWEVKLGEKGFYLSIEILELLEDKVTLQIKLLEETIPEEDIEFEIIDSEPFREEEVEESRDFFSLLKIVGLSLLLIFLSRLYLKRKEN